MYLGYIRVILRLLCSRFSQHLRSLSTVCATPVQQICCQKQPSRSLEAAFATSVHRQKQHLRRLRSRFSTCEACQSSICDACAADLLPEAAFATPGSSICDACAAPEAAFATPVQQIQHLRPCQKQHLRRPCSIFEREVAKKQRCSSICERQVALRHARAVILNAKWLLCEK